MVPNAALITDFEIAKERVRSKGPARNGSPRATLEAIERDSVVEPSSPWKTSLVTFLRRHVLKSTIRRDHDRRTFEPPSSEAWDLHPFDRHAVIASALTRASTI